MAAEPWKQSAPRSQDDAQNERSERNGRVEKRQERLDHGPEKIKPGDPLVTEISKKVSWILRRGMHTLVDVNVDFEGFVKVKDLLTTSQLKDYDYNTLIEQITISNEQKKRYDLKEDDDLDFRIRATKDRSDKKKREEREKREDAWWESGSGYGKGRDRRGEEYGVDKGRTPQEDVGNGGYENSWGTTPQQDARSGGYGGSWGRIPSNDDAESVGYRNAWDERSVNEKERAVEEDRAWKGRGVQTHQEPPDWSSWIQEPKDTSQIGKTWVVAHDVPKVIVRDDVSTDSPIKFTLLPGQVVTQIGPDEDMQWQGVIIRMEISFLDTATNTQCTGWVTKTAEACNGPRFFYPQTEKWINCGPETGDADTDGRSARGNVASSSISSIVSGGPLECQPFAEQQTRDEAGRREYNGTQQARVPHAPTCMTPAQQFLGIDRSSPGSITACINRSAHSLPNPHTPLDSSGTWCHRGEPEVPHRHLPVSGAGDVREQLARAYFERDAQDQRWDTAGRTFDMLPSSGAHGHWAQGLKDARQHAHDAPASYLTSPAYKTMYM